MIRLDPSPNVNATNGFRLSHLTSSYLIKTTSTKDITDIYFCNLLNLIKCKHIFYDAK